MSRHSTFLIKVNRSKNSTSYKYHNIATELYNDQSIKMKKKLLDLTLHNKYRILNLTGSFNLCLPMKESNSASPLNGE